jgi:hypothetical protein
MLPKRAFRLWCSRCWRRPAAANDVDLRSSEFADDGRGLDLALELLRVEAAGGGWRVGVVGHAAAAQLFDPAGSTATPLPAPADATALRARMAAAQAGAAAALQAMTALYAGDAPPPDAAVAALLADEFRHGGLARQDYVERVLQRRDALSTAASACAGRVSNSRAWWTCPTRPGRW